MPATALPSSREILRELLDETDANIDKALALAKQRMNEKPRRPRRERTALSNIVTALQQRIDQRDEPIKQKKQQAAARRLAQQEAYQAKIEQVSKILEPLDGTTISELGDPTQWYKIAMVILRLIAGGHDAEATKEMNRRDYRTMHEQLDRAQVFDAAAKAIAGLNP